MGVIKFNGHPSKQTHINIYIIGYQKTYFNILLGKKGNNNTDNGNIQCKIHIIFIFSILYKYKI
jgi:hypothetical protein